MNDVSAVPASSFVFDSFKKLIEKPVIKKETTRQSQIASLAHSTGWKALCEVIDLYVLQLEQIPVDPNKDDVTSVGFRYLASRVTIEHLRDLKEMPDRYKKLQEAENAGEQSE